MKKQLLSIGLSLIAVLSISTSFAAGNKADDAKSYKTGKGSIVVDGNKTTMLNQKGKFVYSIRRIAADNLPKDIFEIVKNNYDQYYIAGMEKVDQRGLDPVYIVHLEDKTTIKTVKVSGGETELVQDFVKG